MTNLLNDFVEILRDGRSNLCAAIVEFLSKSQDPKFWVCTTKVDQCSSAVSEVDEGL